MRIEVLFGVKSRDIEEAYVWVERATGLIAEARESDAWGGNYYLFGKANEEELMLINNRDPIDGELIEDVPDWGVVLRVETTDAQSPVLQGLENDTEHFEKLSVGS